MAERIWGVSRAEGSFGGVHFAGEPGSRVTSHREMCFHGGVGRGDMSGGDGGGARGWRGDVTRVCGVEASCGDTMGATGRRPDPWSGVGVGVGGSETAVGGGVRGYTGDSKRALRDSRTAVSTPSSSSRKDRSNASSSRLNPFGSSRPGGVTGGVVETMPGGGVGGVCGGETSLYIIHGMGESTRKLRGETRPLFPTLMSSSSR